jgi:U4/U6 small nuclear ribonucleoprotein PRP31
MYDVLLLQIEKWQEPDKAKIKKALPKPDEVKKSRRGGKRVRRFKEKFAMTDVRKEQNKMSFAGDSYEYGDSAMVSVFCVNCYDMLVYSAARMFLLHCI